MRLIFLLSVTFGCLAPAFAVPAGTQESGTEGRDEGVLHRFVRGFQREALVFSGDPAESPKHFRTYKVKPGDTIAAIAKSHGMSADQLIQLNGIDNPNLIRVGQELRIEMVEESPPAAEVVADVKEGEVAPAEVVSTYRIESGDTLSGVAHRHGISVSALMKANPGVDPRRLRVGQEIRLGAPPAVKAEARAHGEVLPRTVEVGEEPKEEPPVAVQPPKVERKTEPAPAPEPVAPEPEPEPKSAKPTQVRIVRSEGDFVRSLAMPSARPEMKRVKTVEDPEDSKSSASR